MNKTHDNDPIERIIVHPFQKMITILSAIVLLVGFATMSHASGIISEASFNGNYAGYITGVGGKAPVTITGILTFNGDGTGSADTIWNLPGPSFTDRVVIPRVFDFNYDVDENGIVELKAETFADLHFVVTRSQRLRGSNTLLALEVQGMSARLETSGGNLIVGTAKRLPNRAEFDARSLKGVYGGLAIGEGGRLSTSVGYLTLNGDGSGSGQTLWNLPDPINILQRKLELIPSTFSYSVNPNGLGRTSVSQENGVEIGAWFVVTETRRVGRRFIAKEIFIIQDDVDPLTGSLVSGPVRRISN